MSTRAKLFAAAGIGLLSVLIIIGGSVTAQSKQGDKASQKMVEKGAYLVNLGGCNDCHTPKIYGPHGPMFDTTRLLSGHPADDAVAEVPEGILAPDKWVAMTNAHFTAWAGPWGVSFARNLTPDKETGLGSWTEEMFIKALRTGKDMGEGRPILPPMPWENFGKLPDEDLKAIYAYLRTIKPVSNAIPEPIPPPEGGNH